MTVIQVQTWKRLRNLFPYIQKGLKIITGVNLKAESSYLILPTTSAGVTILALATLHRMPI